MLKKRKRKGKILHSTICQTLFLAPKAGCKDPDPTQTNKSDKKTIILQIYNECNEISF